MTLHPTIGHGRPLAGERQRVVPADNDVLVKRFTIEGRRVKSFDDFVAATNVGLIESIGGRWNGNLDAFNDYLSWPEEYEYELELVPRHSGFDRLRQPRRITSPCAAGEVSTALRHAPRASSLGELCIGRIAAFGRC